MIQMRNTKIDVIKGMAIILVVLGHCGFPATNFIYLFHMAVFFIASGYCWNEKMWRRWMDCRTIL